MFDKRLIFVFVLLAMQNLCSQQADSMPVIKFDVDTADFGKVYEGDTVRYDFWFTNTGNKDLIIKQAWPACGCTHPTYTQGVIKPGERGKIHVEFLSAGWGGHDVVKEVIIISNAPENYARFKARIVNKAFEEEMKILKNGDPDKKTGKKKKKEKKKKRSKKAESANG
jgi:hypothetical protein